MANRPKVLPKFRHDCFLCGSLQANRPKALSDMYQVQECPSIHEMHSYYEQRIYIASEEPEIMYTGAFLHIRHPSKMMIIFTDIGTSEASKDLDQKGENTLGISR